MLSLVPAPTLPLLLSPNLRITGVERAVTTQATTQTREKRRPCLRNSLKRMVGPNGLEPSTSSVSRKRSNQTELRAYTIVLLYFLRAGGAIYRCPARALTTVLQWVNEKFSPVESRMSFFFFPNGGSLT